MSCETAFWVWLQHGLGAGSGKVRRVLSCCTGLREFWEAGPQFWELQGLFTARELSALRAFSPRDAQRIADRCEKSGIRLLTPEEEGYPRSLWEIANPPCVLYVKGQLPAVDEMPAIAVVGTRDATISGKKIAFSLSYQLARAGAVVISGGARGIDTAAHRGALQARGKTVCVLGCGLEHPYLMENGTLISAESYLISSIPLYLFTLLFLIVLMFLLSCLCRKQVDTCIYFGLLMALLYICMEYQMFGKLQAWIPCFYIQGSRILSNEMGLSVTQAVLRCSYYSAALLLGFCAYFHGIDIRKES